MWDERYAADDYFYGTDPNDFLAEFAHHLPAGPVLCLAEGEGRNAVFLAGRGHAVTAIDSAAEGRNKALRLAAERGVEIDYRVGDLAHFDPGEQQWAGIVSIFAHMPPPLRKALHARLPAALRPGGVLLLEAYTPEQLAHGSGGPPVIELMMDADTLREELPGLEIIALQEIEREVNEGRGHTGTGAVVQLIARRPE